MPVDQGLARLSNDLFFAALLCYAAAMLGYAAEFAARLRTGREAVVDLTEPEPARERVLVSAGVGSVAAPAAPPGLAEGGGPIAPPVAVGHRDRGSREPGALVGRVALAITVVGWLVHIGSVVSRGLAAHRVPWGDMYEFSSIITLLVVTAFLLLATRYRIRHLGAFVLVPVLLYMGLAGTVLYAPAGPLVPALDSYWLKIHVVAAMGASAIFMIGGIVTALYLVRERWERLSASGRRKGWTGIASQLPSAGALDTLAYRVIAFGFPIWTFAIIAGAIWAEAAWGRYWGWDPKETWSFITWVVYAGYLHARATSGWRGRRAAIIALVGFGCLAVDYYVVNLWISGLHSYAGVSA